MRKPSHPNLLKEMVKVQDLEGKYISGVMAGRCRALVGYCPLTQSPDSSAGPGRTGRHIQMLISSNCSGADPA